MHCVPIFLFASVVAGREGMVRPLTRIVKAPIQAIYIEMNKCPMRTRIPSRYLQTSPKLVARILLGESCCIPCVSVVGAATKNNRVKFIDCIISEQLVSQLGPTIDSLEKKTEGILPGVAKRPEPPTLNADSAVGLESLLAIGIDQLNRTRPFPRNTSSRRIGVNAFARIEQVICFHYKRHRGNRQKSIFHHAPVTRILNNIRIHLIVGGNAAPARGKSRRTTRLPENIIEKNKRLSLYFARF